MKSFVVVWFFRLVAWLPLPVSRMLGSLVGHILWLINGQTRQVIDLNLKLCYPELFEIERQQWVQRRLQYLAIGAFELGPSWCWPVDRLLAKLVSKNGEEVMQKALTEQRGVIVLAPHLGNWELIGLYLAHRYPLTTMYQPLKLSGVNELARNSRSRSGSKLAPTSMGGVKTLLKALKAGEVVGVLPDQVPTIGGGREFATFFGRPALTMTLVHNLIQRTGAQVVTAYAKVVPGGWDLIFTDAPEEIYSADMSESLRALNLAVEQCVRDCPDQYQWEYKRFRKQPDGSNPYRQLKESS